MRNKIVDILVTDLKSSSVGSLGEIIGKQTTAPYGLYYMNPSARPSFPMIVYSGQGGSGSKPERRYFTFTVWADNWESIVDRIKTLLHDHPEKLVGMSQGSPLSVKFDWEGPDVFSEDFKVYTKSVRYEIKYM